MAYFNYHALYVQRCFRGYWSRKYICDYYARKAFIAACVLAGKRMRTLSTMNYKLEVSEEQKEAKRKLDEEINKFFSENHHRVILIKFIFITNFCIIRIIFEVILKIYHKILIVSYFLLQIVGRCERVWWSLHIWCIRAWWF